MRILTKVCPYVQWHYLKIDLEAIKHLQLLTLKPTLYIANVEEDGMDSNPWLEKLQALADTEDAQLIAVCAAIEAEVSQLEDDEKQEFLEALGNGRAGTQPYHSCWL